MDTTASKVGRPSRAADDGEEGRPIKGEGIGETVLASDALNSLPLGRWHWRHLARQIVAWAVFSVSQESTAYLFPGFRAKFGASEAQLGHFASAFYIGCLGGTAIASVLVDVIGRRTVMVVAAPMAAALNLCMLGAHSFPLIVSLRALHAVAWSMTMTSIATWYPEFLPTSHRGALQAAVSIGWPLGRAIVILSASWSHGEWQPLVLVSAAGFLILGLLACYAPESPRYLLSCGDPVAANRVLRNMYGSCGDRWDETRTLQLSKEGAAAVQPGGVLLRFQVLWSRYDLVLFSLLLFGVLSVTTVLIDTWGPGLFQKLISPRSHELPHGVLLLFNMGDLLGICASILVADRIGRLGSFKVGFYLQGIFFGAMALSFAVCPGVTALAVALGTAASGCRCFGWEAAQFWTLEAFATEVRGLAFGLSTAAMRLFSILSLEGSSRLMGTVTPATALLIFSGLLIVGGLLAQVLMPMETAGSPMT
eukprot:CAMPEP_0168384828 /NCGR_PEP_ID=MMETSP0228-20121227/14612_1 /TAXON_ID=133427 /ORGANISM="Protoceratium reticulatum, Strain CCCM 535 (=CCMP 1889)" /LENGTH=478 /DNA_ID=CAMNT_0008398007 /DNA_START=54 /DNA_END=1490 /DNA_ORIENTATION=+